MGQSIQIGVAGRVVRLPRRTEHAGDRGKQDEEIQRRIARGNVQIPRTLNLGRHGSIELIERHLGHDAIGQHAGSVDDAAQRRPFFRQLCQSTRKRVGIGHIAANNDDLAAAIANRIQRLLNFGRWSTAG